MGWRRAQSRTTSRKASVADKTLSIATSDSPVNIPNALNAVEHTSGEYSHVIEGREHPATPIAPEATDDPLSPELTTSLTLAQNSLYRFFKEGLSSPTSNWTTFNQIDQVRTAYVGTRISNLAHLIRLGSREPPGFIIYAYPEVHAQSPLSSVQNPGVPTNNTIDRLRSIACFPSKDIRDDLVDSFFTKTHPYFPIVDEAKFREQYRKNCVPVLLLHAVLLVGARTSHHQRVERSRQTVLAILFGRAKQVFDMRHENDRMHLVQAAMLFSWHLQDGDNSGANSWYWLGVACRIAFGLGMHRSGTRDPLTADRMPLGDRRIWRRIWWTLYQAESMAALEHGRPPMIRAGDFDQEPLCKEDFVETNGLLNTAVDFDYAVRKIELCEIALAITCLSAPGMGQLKNTLAQDIARLEKRLSHWALALDVSASDADSFGAINLRLHYHTVVIHLARLSVDQGMSHKLDAHSAVHECGSGAAASILSTLEIMHSRGMMRQCDFTAVTALSSAAIQVSKDLQDAIQARKLSLAINERQMLNRIGNVAKHLSEFWPNAEGIRKVFASILDSFTEVLGTKDMPSTYQDADLQTSPSNDVQLNMDWTEIMAFGSLAPGDIDWDGSLFDLEQ